MATIDTAGEAGTELVDFGRWLFSQECRFLISAAGSEQLPLTDLPEVAFAGRSNVGKSSLVNALTGRKTLARTSNSPGRTRLINFFDLGERLMLVDLPGYGFARAAKGDIQRWTGLTRDYLRGRAQLRRVCLLIDSRHGLKAGDKAMMEVLDAAAVNYQLILTKSDKVKAAPIAALKSDLTRELARHAAAHPDILVTSAHKGQGIDWLRAALGAIALGAPEERDS